MHGVYVPYLYMLGWQQEGRSFELIKQKPLARFIPMTISCYGPEHLAGVLTPKDLLLWMHLSGRDIHCCNCRIFWSIVVYLLWVMPICKLSTFAACFML